jgi:TatD DNase family protein
MDFIDTHCHLDFFDNVSSVIEKAKLAKVSSFIVPSVSFSSALEIIKLKENYPFINASAGIHPTDYKENNTGWKSEVENLDKLLVNNIHSFVAIGETGIDFSYFSSKEDQSIQIQLFKQHLTWAEKNNLPLIIHNRKGNEVLIEMLYGKEYRGVLHSFSGGKAFARKMLETNFYFGIGGLLSRDTGLQEVIKIIPIEKIVLETDSPYLTPRDPELDPTGQNVPANIVYTARLISEIKNTALEEVAKITTDNAVRLFQI